MKGTAKQINWAENIRDNAIAAAGNIVRNAIQNVEIGLVNDTVFFISPEVAREIQMTVIDAFTGMDDAATIIKYRDRFTQSALEKMARTETQRRKQAK